MVYASTGSAAVTTYTTTTGGTGAAVTRAMAINVTSSSGVTTYMIDTDAWGAWNAMRIQALNHFTQTTWTGWCDDHHHEQIRQNMRAWARWNQERVDANEQIRQVLAEDRRLREAAPEEARTAIERHRQEQARRVAEVDAANRKAEELLRRELTEEQIHDLDKKGCFYLETVQPDGTRRRYRIDRGSHGNVKRLDAKGSIIESLCIQPRGVPDADAMLAQKLWLETDEPTFRKVANITPQARVVGH